MHEVDDTIFLSSLQWKNRNKYFGVLNYPRKTNVTTCILFIRLKVKDFIKIVSLHALVINLLMKEYWEFTNWHVLEKSLKVSQ